MVTLNVAMLVKLDTLLRTIQRSTRKNSLASDRKSKDPGIKNKSTTKPIKKIPAVKLEIHHFS